MRLASLLKRLLNYIKNVFFVLLNLAKVIYYKYFKLGLSKFGFNIKYFKLQ